MKKKYIIAGAALFAFIILVRLFAGGAEEPKAPTTTSREVTTALVRDLSSTRAPLPLVGSVKSASEVTLYTEAQGRITRTSYSVGSVVPQGAVIAEIENSSERAGVTQAEGALEAAKASLAKARKGVRDEQSVVLNVQVQNAQSAAVEARLALINAVRDAFSAADDAVRVKVDSFFKDDFRGATRVLDARIRSYSTESALMSEVEKRRIALEAELDTWLTEIDALDLEGDIRTAANSTEVHLTEVRKLLNRSAILLQDLEPQVDLSAETIEGWRGSISLARGNIGGALATLIAKRNANTAAENALAITIKQEEEGTGGARAEDIASLEATVKSAEGSYQAARARLEKTLLRTPISGTLAVRAIETGDFVSMFEPVVKITSEGALEVVTSITEEDKESIRVGSTAVIDGRYDGVVTSVGAALDDRTKKIEVRISLPAEAKERLTSGQSVSLVVTRTEIVKPNTEIIIPISALKIGAQETVVFTIDEDDALVAHPVVPGAIIGEKIIIESGITQDMEIILDARGLKEGESVIIR